MNVGPQAEAPSDEAQKLRPDRLKLHSLPPLAEPPLVEAARAATSREDPKE